ncbi:hypothetical protein SK128_000881, partial [Halocaridina rubra]
MATLPDFAGNHLASSLSEPEVASKRTLYWQMLPPCVRRVPRIAVLSAPKKREPIYLPHPSYMEAVDENLDISQQ